MRKVPMLIWKCISAIHRSASFRFCGLAASPVVILNRLPLYLKSRWIIPRLTLIGIIFGPQVMIFAFNPCFDSCPKENAFAAWPCWPAEVNPLDNLSVSYQLFNRTPRKWNALRKRFEVQVLFCHLLLTDAQTYLKSSVAGECFSNLPLLLVRACSNAA